MLWNSNNNKKKVAFKNRMLKVRQFVSVTGQGQAQTSTNELASSNIPTAYTESNTKTKLCIHLRLILGMDKVIEKITH